MVFSTSHIFAKNIDSKGYEYTAGDIQLDYSNNHLIKTLKANKFSSTTQLRKNGAFLLTGVVVYNTLKYTGYAACGFANVGSIGVAFVTAGPVGAVGAYTAFLAAFPATAAGIESGALMIGTSASFIPGLL